jgi:hypothetical protein
MRKRKASELKYPFLPASRHFGRRNISLQCERSKQFIRLVKRNMGLTDPSSEAFILVKERENFQRRAPPCDPA